MKPLQSAERVSAADASDNYVFQRSLLAYYEASRMISGRVLEIGTGSGYGISVISPHAEEFVTIDKYPLQIDTSAYPNVSLLNMKVPPLEGIASDSFDYVIMFQVIEHIKDDKAILREIFRVLKPAGKLIISTPNKPMSLSRNPWHIREYTAGEFGSVLGSVFGEVQANGVFGREKVMEYYQSNRKSVERIARYDIFAMRKWLPNFLYRIPYDILNRMNRRKLLQQNRELTSDITMDDYYVAPLDLCGKSNSENYFDLFFVAVK